MKETYEKPQIVRIGHPVYAKHGLADSQSLPVIDSVDGVSVASLLAKFGSPVFIFSEKTLIEKLDAAKQAFETRYPKVSFGWSYKTNYLKAICQVFHQKGTVAEVVSDFEYERARSLGIPGDRILFNGPYKSKKILEQAITEDSKIHIDSIEEISDLEEIARRVGQKKNNPKKKPSVAIRINMDVGIQPQWSRFGFNLENGQAFQAVERLMKGGELDLEGLHTHLGTFIMDSRSYSVAVSKLIEFERKIAKQYGVQIKYLDLGGGFASHSHLKGVYQPPEISVPSIDDYAESITSTLKKEWNHGSLPELVLETGRHLVDEAGYLVASVVSTKLLPDSRRAYVLDAGVNLLYTTTWYRPEVALTQKASGVSTPATLVGPLCMNIDVVHDGLMLPRLEKGAQVVLHPVGAYNVTQWMQFIQYRPAVVMIRKNGNVDLIRKRETLENMDACEILPDDLK